MPLSGQVSQCGRYTGWSGSQIEAITALKKGAYLLNYGQRGKPKFCPFQHSADESVLIWCYGKDEKKTEPREVIKIIPGQHTAQPEKTAHSLSFLSFVAKEISNGRNSTSEAARVSVSSALSSSSQALGCEDFDAVGDVLICMFRVGSSSRSNIGALLPKALESTAVLDVHNIACGGRHAVLVMRQGDIFKDVSHPKLIEALIGINIELVACGEYHSCAVTHSGDFYTWGDDSYNSGLPGQRKEVSHWIPKRVGGLLESLQVVYISSVYFGEGTFGALGLGDHRSPGTPREVEALKGLPTMRVACGVWHTAAVVQVMPAGSCGSSRNSLSGKLFLWGEEDKGQLGHGDKESRLVPEFVAGLVDLSICKVACGHNLALALTTSGQVYTMGTTAYGQLRNPVANGKTPTCSEGKIANSFIEEIACGSYHVAVLTSKTEVYTWGKGSNGQLGHGDCDDRDMLTLAEFLKNKQVKSIACGATFTAVIYLHKLVANTESSVCYGCHSPFTFRRRRHNCNNCGFVFCKTCSSRKSLKPSLAPSMDKPYRVCNDCFKKLRKVTRSGSVAQIPEVKSVSTVHKSNNAGEREIGNPWLQGKISRLWSFDSLKMSERRNSKHQAESNDSNISPLANINIQRESNSSPKISNALLGTSKKIFQLLFLFAHLSDSPLPNGIKDPNKKTEWVVHYEPGVYITLSSLPGDKNELKKVRFSRKIFTEEQAEKRWAENGVKVYEQHNIQMAH
ncbi:hypothetical protein NMG60_11009201 [Bertholletia excelsa]